MDAGRPEGLFRQLALRFTRFVGELPEPLPALAAAHPGFFGEAADTGTPVAIPVPASARLPFLFWPLFRDLDDQTYLDIAYAGACLYTGSVLLDHILDGQVPDPGGFSQLQRAFWEHGDAAFRNLFPPEADFWAQYDDLLADHAAALEAELHAQAYPESLTRDSFRAIAAGKTGPAVVIVAALAHAAGKPGMFPPLAASIRAYGLALQIVDDLQDWEDDLLAGHLTYFLRCAVPGAVWGSPEARCAPETVEAVASGQLLLDHWRTGIEAFDQALAAVHDLHCPGWSDQVFLQRTLSDAQWLKAIARHVARALEGRRGGESARRRGSESAMAKTRDSLARMGDPIGIAQVHRQIRRSDEKTSKTAQPQAVPKRIRRNRRSDAFGNHALSKTIHTLLSYQDPAGAWKEFDIPNARASDAWVTAHIGLKLATLPARLRGAEVEAALANAADFLATQWRHGWGYNARIPVDADSTAHVLLFFEAVGRAAPMSTIPALLEHQQPDGGFGTYNGRRSPNIPESWCLSAPDITPVVARALAPYQGRASVREALDRAVARLETDRLADGRWPAFWWVLEWYAAHAWLAACSRLGAPLPAIELPQDFTPLSNLDRALLLELALDLGDRTLAASLRAALLSAQLDSGLWPIQPALCQPLPGVVRPWELEVREVVYPEVRGLYSSATILGALGKASGHLSASDG